MVRVRCAGLLSVGSSKEGGLKRAVVLALLGIVVELAGLGEHALDSGRLLVLQPMPAQYEGSYDWESTPNTPAAATSESRLDWD